MSQIMQQRQHANDYVAAELRAVMARKQIGRRELARQMDKSHTWVSRRVAGDTPISVEDLGEIAAALGVPMHALIPNEGDAA